MNRHNRRAAQALAPKRSTPTVEFGGIAVGPSAYSYRYNASIAPRFEFPECTVAAPVKSREELEREKRESEKRHADELKDWTYEKLTEYTRRHQKRGSVSRADESFYRAVVVEVKRRRIARRFIREYELTDEEFASNHWQTLFAIQNPEAR
jgi:hypothetical protein